MSDVHGYRDKDTGETEWIDLEEQPSESIFDNPEALCMILEEDEEDVELSTTHDLIILIIP